MPSTLPSTRSPEFLSSLIVNDDFGLPFTLFVPLVFYSALLTRLIVVPEGFKTDLASIPIGLWNILPKSGRYDRAAVCHDYLYQYNGCTRSEADSVLDEAMGVLKVNGFKKFLIYRGVRLGGGPVWRKYRNKKDALVETERVQDAIDLKGEKHEFTDNPS